MPTETFPTLSGFLIIRDDGYKPRIACINPIGQLARCANVINAGADRLRHSWHPLAIKLSGIPAFAFGQGGLGRCLPCGKTFKNCGGFVGLVWKQPRSTISIFTARFAVPVPLPPPFDPEIVRRPIHSPLGARRHVISRTPND